MPATNKVWTKTEILALLDTNPIFVERALIKLYNRQTSDEKATQDTKHTNNRGFNGGDAKLMSKFAQWVLNGKAKGIPEGKLLSEKQRALTVKRIKKYAGQLVEEANTK